MTNRQVTDAPLRDERTPLTVLAGFLGAGKTTLVNRILSGDHGRRVAVVVNEFGSVPIDHELLVSTDEERIVALPNGCVCCIVRKDLLDALHGLLARRHERLFRKGVAFDHVVIETSGLADPGPVAQTLVGDEEIRRALRLDGIVTIVDALYGPRHLDEGKVALEQAAFADLLVLNKIDLVDEASLAATEARLRALNPLAPVVRARDADVDLARVIDLRSTELEGRREDAAGGPWPSCGVADPSLRSGEAPDDPPDHAHDPRVGSFVIETDEPLDPDALQYWVLDWVERHWLNVYRAKGIVNVAGERRRFVFQTVHRTFAVRADRLWRDDEARTSRIVFIGRYLNEVEEELRGGFQRCLSREPRTSASYADK